MVEVVVVVVEDVVVEEIVVAVIVVATLSALIDQGGPYCYLVVFAFLYTSIGLPPRTRKAFRLQ